MPYPHQKLFLVLAALSLISLTLVGCDERRSEQGQEVSVRGPEEKVALAQVPAPVKATIEQVAKGGTLKVIKKGTVDGKTLYWSGPTGAIWSARVTTGDRMAVGMPSIWAMPKADVSSYSISIDGERLLASVQDDAGSQIAPRVIVNWRALVEKR